MRNLIYNDVRKLKSGGWQKKLDEATGGKMQVTHIFFNLGRHTRSILSYSELIRLISDKYQVYIYRNKFEADGGIILAGPESVVVTARKHLQEIVQRVELVTSRKRKTRGFHHVHLSELKAKERSKCQYIYTETFWDLPQRPVTYSELNILKSYCSAYLFKIHKRFVW